MRRRPASPTRRPLRLFLAPTLVGAIGIATGLAAIAPSAVAGERGLHFLDAPVSGGEAGAVNGALTVMVGGDEAVFAHTKPVVDA